MSAFGTRLGVLLIAVGASPACDGGSSGEGGAGGTGAATSVGGSIASGGDVGDRCAEALDLTARTNSLGGVYYEHQGAIESPGDRDCFRVHPEAGQWFGMATEANPDDDPSKVDTVLTLFNETGESQLAHDDGGADSTIYTRFEQAGAYCLELADRSDWRGEPPARGDPSFRYRLLAFPVDFELYDDWNLDQEPNDEPDSAQPLSVVHYQGHPSTRVGGLLAEDDVDTYRLVTGPIDALATVSFAPIAPSGGGSTIGSAMVRLRREDEPGAVLAELDYQWRAGLGLLVEVEPDSSYLLEVSRPAGVPVGTNDFYLLTIDAAFVAVNELEPNDTPETTTHLYQAADPYRPEVTTTGFLGRLQPGDVDWWGVSAQPGSAIEVWCASWGLGSSLRDATFTLYPPKCAPGACFGPAEDPLQAQTETLEAGVLWSDDPWGYSPPSLPAIVTPHEGTHYLEVTATQYDPGIESVIYRCTVTVTGA